jgi:hypothetical protein
MISIDSQHRHRRFVLCLDETSAAKLETLAEHFDRPMSEIVRQLLAQVTPKHFPKSWHLAVGERQPCGAGMVGRRRAL